MADEDFDIEKLAAYLHLDVNQVTKLADRGKLPGRRVAGAWRFSPAEIHHWLEERIGLSDSHELARVEEALDRDRKQRPNRRFRSRTCFHSRRSILRCRARTRNSVITSMVELAAQSGWLWDPAKMSEAVRSREDMFPTALETGVALLHPRPPAGDDFGTPFSGARPDRPGHSLRQSSRPGDGHFLFDMFDG